MAFIRSYEPQDFEAMAHICRETLPPTLDASKGAHILAPYLWTHPYTYHSPSTCLVLDFGDGTVVGYCIACPDVLALKAAWPAYLAAVVPPSIQAGTSTDEDKVGRHLGHLLNDPQALLIEGCEELVRRGVKATMHIDLLGEWQRRGWGAQLVEGVVARLMKQRSVSLNALIDDDGSSGGGRGAKGVFVGVAGENAKVVPFYHRVGFRLWQPEGAEKGRRDEGETILMLREFPGDE